jgi:hypothetical protein
MVKIYLKTLESNWSTMKDYILIDEAESVF